MGNKPTEARAYGAQYSPALVQSPSICWSLSGDGLMDPSGGLGLQD